jgi:hypothetical protein
LNANRKIIVQILLKKQFDDFFEKYSKIFQIKQSSLSNQVGGCWSLYCEHTPKPLFFFAKPQLLDKTFLLLG